MTYSYLDNVRASATIEGPSTGAKVFRWMVGLLAIGHGLVHVMGPIQIWGIADIQSLSGSPALAVGDTTTRILALMWLGAMIVLLIAGLGALTGHSWWPRWALSGAILSQLVIAMWWSDAATGTIPNILIAAAAVWVDRVDPLLDSEFV
ncbi:MAG: hypothetical protein WEB67_05440 [Acidimicrobiia bacterium]